jgi:hypothetical protein
MKKPLAVLLALAVCIALGASQNLLTLKVVDEPFSSVVKMIEEQAKVEIVVLNPIEGKVSLEANKATINEVLDALTRQVSARWEEGYLITTKKCETPKKLGGPIVSLQIKEGTPASDVFKSLEEASKVKILVNPDVKGTVPSLNFKNQKLERILNRLCSSLGVYWQKVYIISKPQGVFDWEKFLSGLNQAEQGQTGEQGQQTPGQRFWDQYQRFLQLSPEERVNLMSNLFDRLFSLSPDQRDRIIQGVAVFLSNAVSGFLSLPPERQSEVARFAMPILEAGAAAYNRLPADKRQLLKPWVDAFAPLEGYRLPR